MDNLSATALAARRAGMSYGKYVALHGVRKVIEPIVIDEPKKVCKGCGKEFLANSRGRLARYCSPECQYRFSIRASLYRYHSRKKEADDGK